MVYWRIFGAWKEKNKSADVIWRGFDAICVYANAFVENGYLAFDRFEFDRGTRCSRR